MLGSGLIPCSHARNRFTLLLKIRVTRRGRAVHTATLLPSGKVLVAGSLTARAPLASAELYVRLPGPGAPPAASPPHAISHGDVAAQRQSARREVINGCDISRARNCPIQLPGPGATPAASPPHATFTRRRCCPVARCSSQEGLTVRLSCERGTVRSSQRDVDSHRQSRHRRNQHTATLLANGKVLVAGGYERQRLLTARNCTIRPPGPGVPPATSPPYAIRHGDVAAQWQGARRRRKCSRLLTSAELYDPATGTWSATGSLATARHDHTATMLPNGKVLVDRRILWRSGILPSAELYDPAIGTGRHRQPRRRTVFSHGDVAARRQGARGRWILAMAA